MDMIKKPILLLKTNLNKKNILVMKKLLLISGLGLLLLGSCNPYQVVNDYNQSANFSSYKTYQLDPQSFDSIKMNDIDKSRLNTEITKQLTAKGLQMSNNPDLMVKISANYKIIKDVQGANMGYNPWSFGGYGGGFGFGMNRAFSSERPSGGLQIDMIDNNTKKLVWQGKGIGIDVDSPKRKAKQIPAMISEMMENYPPKK